MLRSTVILLALVLSACTATTQRSYERCIVGLTTAGGAAGGVASSGSGVVPGAAVGAAAGALFCSMDKPEPPVIGDSDGDGVNDDQDRCPGTSPGVAVDARGCPLDSDGDGVEDTRDACPGTARGTEVDSRGCEKREEVRLTVRGVGFAFDSSVLDERAQRTLDEAVAVLKRRPSAVMSLIGHTDSIGTDAYNQGLSERRARAVADYLTANGIDRDRLTVSGKGENNPIASNATAEGRAENRRVELVIR